MPVNKPNDYSEAAIAGLHRLPPKVEAAAIHVAPHMRLTYMVPEGVERIRTTYGATVYDVPHGRIVGDAPLPHNRLAAIRRHGLGSRSSADLPGTGRMVELTEYYPDAKIAIGHPFAIGNVSYHDAGICRGNGAGNRNNAHRDPCDHWDRFISAPFNDHMVESYYHETPRSVQEAIAAEVKALREGIGPKLREKAQADAYAADMAWTGDRAEPRVDLPWPPECDPIKAKLKADHLPLWRALVTFLTDAGVSPELVEKARANYLYRKALWLQGKAMTDALYNKCRARMVTLKDRCAALGLWLVPLSDAMARLGMVQTAAETAYTYQRSYVTTQDRYYRNDRDSYVSILRQHYEQAVTYLFRGLDVSIGATADREAIRGFCKVTLPGIIAAAWENWYSQDFLREEESRIRESHKADTRRLWYAGAWKDGRMPLNTLDMKATLWPQVGVHAEGNGATHALLSDNPGLLRGLPDAYLWPTGHAVEAQGKVTHDRSTCANCADGDPCHLSENGNTPRSTDGSVPERVAVGWAWRTPDNRYLIQVVGMDGTHLLYAWDEARGYRRYRTRDALRATPKSRERAKSHIARMRTLRGVQRALRTEAGRKMAESLLSHSKAQAGCTAEGRA